MPKNAPQTKIDATAGYGADVELDGYTFQEAMAHAKSIVDDESTTSLRDTLSTADQR